MVLFTLTFTSALPGITRDAIIKLAKGGIEVREQVLSRESLYPRG